MIVEGRGGVFLGIAGVLCAGAVGMPAALYLSGTPLGKVCGTLDPSNVVKVWAVVLGIAGLLGVVSAYYRSRRLTLDDRALHLDTWFSHETWPLAAVAALSLRTERVYGDNQMPQTFVVLWDKSDHSLGEVGLRGWDMPRFQELFRAIARRPGVQVSPELRNMLASPEAAAHYW